MTTWTKELPKASGFYWWRPNGGKEQIALLDAADRTWQVFGRKGPTTGSEWWPERILAPEERFSLKVKPEMWKHLSSLFTPGNTAPYVPGKPTSFQVELDPNHPHA